MYRWGWAERVLDLGASRLLVQELGAPQLVEESVEVAFGDEVRPWPFSERLKSRGWDVESQDWPMQVL